MEHCLARIPLQRESLDSLKRHLSNDFKNRPLFTTEAWDRSFGGTLGKRNEDPKVQIADMDLDGIEIQVVFPTHLSLNSEKETAPAVDIARAYNDWLAEFCSADRKRLKGVAMVALQEEESTVSYVIDRIGSGKLLYSSGYPHWDISWPKTVGMFQGRRDISEADKRQTAWENPQKFYGFKAAA
jgi:predicted TIM-barrel fold metal-dependent hydrolase